MVLRREVKNIVKNFSTVEVKVREATSNDPWGPPTSLLSEIADATNNDRALTEIMQMLWKRINENGKNWRHVYKSLVVLEYILKTGNESVANQCKDNLFVLKTLESFGFVDKEGKDHGVNVRERSKQLVTLLEDDVMLKDECERAVKAKRIVHTTGGSGNTATTSEKKYRLGKKSSKRSDSVENSNVSASDSNGLSSDQTEIDNMSPSNKLEEDLQLQIALAESNEEAENAEKAGTIDWNVTITSSGNTPPTHNTAPPPTQISLLDLDDPPIPTVDASNNNTFQYVESSSLFPVDSIDASNNNTFQSVESSSLFPRQPIEDPWGFSSSNSSSSLQDNNNTNNVLDLFSPSFDDFVGASAHAQMRPSSINFLDVGAHLVDLDNIVSTEKMEEDIENTTDNNPFKASSACPSKNPFFQEKPKPMSINELRINDMNSFASQTFANDLRVSANESCHNPFRSLMVAT